MEREPFLPIEQMDVFHRYVEVADWAWETVGKWPPLARGTVGTQLVRAIDSVGANLVEGDGRRGINDSLRFFVIARASAREARYWLERALSRKLISEDEGRTRLLALTSATQMLNRLIAYRRTLRAADRVRETQLPYISSSNDPFMIEDAPSLEPGDRSPNTEYRIPNTE